MLRKLFIFTIVLLLSLNVISAASGDSMTIGGVVPLILNLTMTQDPGADDLDLDSATGPVTGITIASITVDTNSSAGWELVVMSENGGTLKNAVPTDTPISYTCTYVQGASGSSTSTGAQGLTTAGVILTQDTARTTAGTPEPGTLQIAYNQSTTYPAGYYSDLLTVTLRAK